MFGESDSESPRAGSPWDTLLLASSPNANINNDGAASKLPYGIPKLSPEAEEVCRLVRSLRSLVFECLISGECRIQTQTHKPFRGTLC